MNEEDASTWLDNLGVSRGTKEKLDLYVSLLLSEANHQNLIATSTRNSIWARHIVDSAQLLPIAPGKAMERQWIDLGSGAGLPGIVIAILSSWNVIMIESRHKRAAFLEDVITRLSLQNASVICGKVQTVISPEPAAVISARAFAPLSKLFAAAEHLADDNTFWLLPRGKSWQTDLQDASKFWHGVFHVERSVTDEESAIVIATSVRRKTRQ